MKEFSTVTGLSRPTVSKYFHDPDSVRLTTRKKIESALEHYDFRPNFFAVNQNRRSPKTLGIIVPQLTDPFYAEIVARLERAAIDAGYFAITLSSHGSPEHEARAIEMIRSLNIGAVILAPLGDASDIAAIRQLQDEVPLLMFDSLIDGVDAPMLGCDNAQGMRLMVDHLCTTGSPPCYVDMPEANSTARERRAAYQAAMESQGFAPMVLPAVDLGWRFEAVGAAVTRRALADGGFPSPTVLCANDRFAIGVLSAASTAGLRVGPTGDLRVAGHDDHPAAAYTAPSLTTVAQDTDGLAERAIEISLRMIENGPRPEARERTPSRLVLRESA